VTEDFGPDFKAKKLLLLYFCLHFFAFLFSFFQQKENIHISEVANRLFWE